MHGQTKIKFRLSVLENSV